VLLLVGALVVGTLIGLALGGSLRSLADLTFRWWPLAIVGLGLQFVPTHSHAWAVGLLIASYAVLVVFFAANIRTPGMPLIALGFVLNIVVIGVNGGMPVSDQALRLAYGSGYAEQRRELVSGEGGAKHHLQGSDDHLTWLADEIPVPSPVRIVVSVGDLVSLVGAGWLLARATMVKGTDVGQTGAERTTGQCPGGTGRGIRGSGGPVRPGPIGGRWVTDRRRRRARGRAPAELPDEGPVP
jgi:hypothetical protein